MDRSQKADAIVALNANFQEVGVVVVTRNLGMTVAQSSVLRGKIREAGATYKVAKNSLAKLAVKGTSYEALGDLFTGPTAIASSVDPVAAAKAIVEFAKTTDKIEIVGGAIGSQVLNADGIKALASLPSLTPTTSLPSLNRIILRPPRALNFWTAATAAFFARDARFATTDLVRAAFTRDFTAADFAAGFAADFAADFAATTFAPVLTGAACALLISKTAVGMASAPMRDETMKPRLKRVRLIFMIVTVRPFL